MLYYICVYNIYIYIYIYIIYLRRGDTKGSCVAGDAGDPFIPRNTQLRSWQESWRHVRTGGKRS